jgi:hypothetical protein
MIFLLFWNLLASYFSVVGSICRNLWKEQGIVNLCEAILPDKLNKQESTYI